MKLINADRMIAALEAENEQSRHKRENADEESRVMFRKKIIELLQKEEAACKWHDPEKKMPADDEKVLITVSGMNKEQNYRCDHAVKLGSYVEGEGWFIEEDLETFTVHEWCEIPEGYSIEK